MKTPREVLLARHAQAENQLASVTDKIVADLVPPKAPLDSRAQWLDWLWPSPLAWGGLAAAWMLILTLNGGSLDFITAPTVARAQRPPEVEQALQEQRRLLTEMVGLPGEETVRPGPRSSIQSSLNHA